jgi:hypothetical protein
VHSRKYPIRMFVSWERLAARLRVRRLALRSRAQGAGSRVARDRPRLLVWFLAQPAAGHRHARGRDRPLGRVPAARGSAGPVTHHHRRPLRHRRGGTGGNRRGVGGASHRETAACRGPANGSTSATRQGSIPKRWCGSSASATSRAPKIFWARRVVSDRLIRPSRPRIPGTYPHCSNASLSGRQCVPSVTERWRTRRSRAIACGQANYSAICRRRAVLSVAATLVSTTGGNSGYGVTRREIGRL